MSVRVCTVFPAHNLLDLDSGEGGEMLETARSLLDFLGFFG